MNKYLFLFVMTILFNPTKGHSQQTVISIHNAEDSMNSSSASKAGTMLGGYGNAFVKRDFNTQTTTADLERFVLFIGHKFSKNISIFSELEVEDAKVVGGESGGEIALEQAYLKFNLDQNNYFVAGLFLPRMGLLNENHLPTAFNGNERSQVETYIIPSTWRELGIGFYGSISGTPLNYTLGVVNGLNSAGFEHGTGIIDGRFEGRNATMNNLALTGALQLNLGNLRTQLCGYYGGSVGLSPRQADSLKLTSGIFGTPIAIGEADITYSISGFILKALATTISIPNASDINRAYANNTPEQMYGTYGEIGYDIFHSIEKIKSRKLIVFVRYEKLDLNSKIPSNGLIDGTLNQSHIITGLTYLPIKNVVLKADVRLMQTGNQNPDLIINPSPVALPYRTTNTFFNLGVGYSF